MSETVTLKGKPLKLKGNLIKKGEKAPDCTLTNGNLDDISLSSFQGKPLLIMTVPSLDTPVCSKEIHRFNQELGRFGDSLTALAVSMDLPFAQKRWCSGEDVDYFITLSDYKNREFGEKFGVLISDLGLLARAVFILDSDFQAVYVCLVKETSEEPNYEEIFEELAKRVR